MSPTHPLTRAAAAAAILAVLAGCSTSHDKDPNRPGAEAATRISPGEGPGSSSPTGSVTPSGTVPDSPAPAGPASSAGSSSAAPDSQSLTDWPSEPAPGTAVPVVKSQVIKRGYTGESYLNRFAATWGITLDTRQKVEFPGRPTVWHTSGVKRSGEVATSIAAVWSLDGDLISLSCSVTASATKRADFLHDCASLDHPGAAPASATAWLDAMEPRVANAFASGQGTVIDSPLHRSGPVATVLQKARDASYGGDYYQLRSFGTGSS
ncbi:hypothetical protein [Kitasatospora sp. NPDC088351]|uniref:hypothetical protein n=1 Tax=unclassified Kitasatospora TaxID=2633591 RepID=UPI00343C9A47